MTAFRPTFPYTPILTAHVSDVKNAAAMGDIRLPWTDVARNCGCDEFTAKVSFAIGMIVSYIEAANAILMARRWQGFIPAFAVLASGIELFGRCLHADEAVRQHPSHHSGKRLKAALEYLKLPRLRAEVVVETNHFPESVGGYSIDDLTRLRNFATHGASIDLHNEMKADIELLHEIRKALLGVVAEEDPHSGHGPIPGALDRYLNELMAGDTARCDQVASAAISPAPLTLHAGAWRPAEGIVRRTLESIAANHAAGHPLVLGGRNKAGDGFQLYP